MIRFTPATLKKLEDALKECSYEVRYEKGNFKSGYCLLEERKVVMVNKFSTLESRIQSLAEIILNLNDKEVIHVDVKQLGLSKLNAQRTSIEDALIFNEGEATFIEADINSNS